jgi:Family of unknown function (DUF6152)
MRTQLVLAVAVGLSIVAHPSPAHHSFAAEFDAAKPFELTGTVTQLVWSNPHAWIYFDVLDEKTKTVTNWAVELNSPNALLRAGWTRNSLRPGDVVTIEGSLAKDGSPTGNARSVVTSTGQRLFAGSSQNTTP